MCKKIGIIGIILMLLSFSGCISVEITGSENDNTCSREYVNNLSSSYSFGKGRMDDIYVALKYIYSNSDIRDTYGSEFEIVLEDIVCNKCEGETFIFKSIYKGKADYSIKISNEIYRIKLNKNYFSAWTVSDFYLDKTGDGS